MYELDDCPLYITAILSAKARTFEADRESHTTIGDVELVHGFCLRLTAQFPISTEIDNT